MIERERALRYDRERGLRYDREREGYDMIERVTI